MKNLKYVLYAAIVTSTMIFVPTASANPYGGSASYGGLSYGGSSIGIGTHGESAREYSHLYSSHNVYRRVLNGSDTASFYYKIGINNYDKGNLEKAERAFEAVLRANGLDKQANLYLARISEKQGDKIKMVKYAKAYHGLDKK